jgi:hypothetical protein
MSAICGPSARVVCNSAIYNDKDEAANRGGVPTLRVLFFSRPSLQSAVAIPAAPKLHRESQPPLCEPGLMGLTSRQARFVSGPQIRTLPDGHWAAPGFRLPP